MNFKKMMLCIAVCLLVSVSCSAYAQETGEDEIESGYVYFDIDGDGVDEGIFTDGRRAVIDGMDFEIEGDFYRAFLSDVTGDGKDEMVVASKERGSSSSLSYKVYSIEYGVTEVIFERSGLYRGTLDVEDGNLVERAPVYGEGDSNADPSMTRRDVYIYEGSGFALEESLEYRPVTMQSSEGYSNPSRSEIEKMIEDVGNEKGIPPVILKAIAYTESGMRQFDGGSPLVSFDGVSYGIMQVTPGVHTSYDLYRLKYDIRYNIEAGASILLSKWDYAFKTYPAIPTIGEGDPGILENWYFAIWAYNGWSQSNNPNMIPYEHATWTQRQAYQDKVLGYAYSQFGQAITPVDADDLPESGLPDKYASFSTPKPSHDADFGGYLNGDVIVCTAASGLVLRNDNWDKIGNVPNGSAMAVVKGPQLHNGYLRYNVKVIGDGGAGWVAMNWTKAAKSADVDGNGKVSMEDVEAIRGGVGLSGDTELDINGSGIVDSYDVAVACYMAKAYQDDWFEKWCESVESVSENKVWTVKFSAGVDSVSALGGEVYVVDEWGALVEAGVESAGADSVRIKPPSGGYDAGGYRICIGENIRSAGGESIEKGFYMDFTVR